MLNIIEHTFLLKAPCYVLLLVIGIVKDGITTFYTACILVIILTLLTGLLSNKEYILPHFCFIKLGIMFYVFINCRF